MGHAPKEVNRIETIGGSKQMNKIKGLALALCILAAFGLTQSADAYHESVEAEEAVYEAHEVDGAEEPTIPSSIWTEKSANISNELSPAPPPVPSRWTEDDVVTLSRMVWGEGRGVSRNEQKLIVWTVLNRLDNGRYGSSIRAVVTARGQFVGYRSGHPVTDAIRSMVVDVLDAWDRGEVALVYPPFARYSNYLYFNGDGRHNWFRARHRR